MHMRDQLHLGYAGPITFGKPQMEPKQLMMGSIFWEDQIILKGPKPLWGTRLGVGTNVFWLCGLTDIRPFTPAHDPSILSLQAHESKWLSRDGATTFCFSESVVVPWWLAAVFAAHASGGGLSTDGFTRYWCSYLSRFEYHQLAQNYFEKAVLRRKISRGMEYVLLYRISILLLSLQYRFKTK